MTVTVATMCSEDLRSTVGWLLAVDSASRPSASDVPNLACVKQLAASLLIALDDGSTHGSATGSKQDAGQGQGTAAVSHQNNCGGQATVSKDLGTYSKGSGHSPGVLLLSASVLAFRDIGVGCRFPARRINVACGGGHALVQ